MEYELNIARLAKELRGARGGKKSPPEELPSGARYLLEHLLIPMAAKGKALRYSDLDLDAFQEEDADDLLAWLRKHAARFRQVSKLYAFLNGCAPVSRSASSYC